MCLFCVQSWVGGSAATLAGKPISGLMSTQPQQQNTHYTVQNSFFRGTTTWTGLDSTRAVAVAKSSKRHTVTWKTLLWILMLILMLIYILHRNAQLVGRMDEMILSHLKWRICPRLMFCKLQMRTGKRGVSKTGSKGATREDKGKKLPTWFPTMQRKDQQ
jgi:hypothetical protein